MKSIKVKIYPKKSQIELIEKHFGCSRFVYNWGLARKIEHYQSTKKTLNKFDLIKELTQLKKEKETEWLKEVNAQSLQQTIADLDSAFCHFFRHNNKFPRFKSKRSPKQNCRVPQSFRIEKDKHYVKLPKLGWIRFKDKFNVPNDAEFRNITVSKKNDKYYISITYQTEEKEQIPKIPTKKKTLGIDLGISYLATYSDGTKTDNPRHLKVNEDKLKIIQQKLSKQKKGSNQYNNTKRRLNKLHEKVSNTRKDFLHKLTTSLVENQDYTSLAIEDLAVKQMQQSNFSPMSKAIGDVGWRMFRQMLEYKCKDKGKNLLVIGRFDASSKTCCNCGYVYHELDRSEKEWICKKCKVHHDRDINAAMNIKQFGFRKFQEVGQSSSEQNES